MKHVVVASLAAFSAAALGLSQPAFAETTIVKKHYDDMGERKVIIKKHHSWGEGPSRKVVIKRGMSDPETTGSVRVKKVIRHEDY
ncbi:hypothetical protein [Chelatococcus reniformis]|uniref:Uncharacterized protein n=1 Tax=Chelatococcus reniformis TaxID=1494448 RepID=A0A916XM01_9HYPH|nr:hypothetical protein [Chelatococcus reniformis]GGC81697.1 hypothetical protein GCM10010994_44580 [Chelatococcus reniformis]